MFSSVLGTQATAPSLFSTPATTTPSLFATPGAGTTATTGAPSLFSLTPAATTTPAFSLTTPATTTTTATTAAPSLFSLTPAATTSSTTTAPVGTLFQTTPGTPAASANQVPGQVDWNTLYDNLPAQWKADIAKLVDHTAKEQAKAEEIDQRSTEHIDKITRELETAVAKANTLTNTLDNDQRTIKEFRSLVSEELKNAELAARDLERLSATGGGLNLHYALPSRYFMKLAESFETRLMQYKRATDEVEQFLASASINKQFSPQMLQETMRHQHELFMSVASQIAVVHEHTSLLREKYIEYRQSRGLPETVEEFFYKEEYLRRQQAKVKTVAPTREQMQQQAAAATPAGAATPAAATTGGLFSLTPTTPSTGTTGLFGGLTTPGATTTSPTGSLFGATPAAAGGLFGAATPTPSLNAGLGLSAVPTSDGRPQTGRKKK
eukprot:TRINITY_DN1507_c0_g1_i1.p1 TRINITY_DN1507_c0_g1~~TRINITY_DN1507_c0_g1_i1.p1  ORF type:complete len:438 (-),score=110.18 TRINITY_DN1507_c0_g1_i1:87-1400(-)